MINLSIIFQKKYNLNKIYIINYKYETLNGNSILIINTKLTLIINPLSL